MTISCTTVDATIYYTTGDGDPTTKYTEPITVSETTTIKAQAKKGSASSSVVTATYTISTPSVASLPFEFTGGRSDIANKDGLSQSGLEDYNATTYPNTKLKFGDTGDNLILHFNETPGKLSFYIKSFSFSTGSSGQFTVQTSTDGISYTNLKTYTSADNITENNNGQSEEFDLAANVRYIKWIYTKKISGNIGLGNIKVEKPAKPSAGLAFTPTEVTVNLGDPFTQPTLTNEHNVTVTYTSSNENVATVSSDGAVSIVGAGKTTITASFVGDDTYAPGNASYILTVVDPNANDGTMEKPFTVAEAIAFIATLGGSTSSEVYVKGIISQIDRVTVGGTAQYWISDDGTTTTQLEIYAGKSLEGNYFQALNEICVDDHVVVCGQLKLYNTTNEFTSDSKIHSLARDRYYVAGSWTNWQNGKIEMAKSQDGKSYTLDGQELQAGVQFKIIKVAYDASDGIWHGGTADPGTTSWVTADNHTNISLIAGGGENFYMPIAGTWTFTVDPTAGTLTVDGTWPEASYYLMGDFNMDANDNWLISDDYMFTKDETTGKYTLSATIENGKQFKIIKSYDQTVGNDDTWYGAVSNGNFDFLEQYVDVELSLASPGENYLMKLSNASAWNLSFDPTNYKLVLSNYIDPNKSTVYQKVTDASQIVAGKEYIIVCETHKKAMGDQGPNYSYNYRTHVDVTISDNKVDIDNKPVVILTLGGEEGAWTFKASDTKQYLSASAVKELKNTDDATSQSAKWKIISSGDGGYIVESVNSAVGTIQYNQTNSSSTSRFATYTSNQSKAYLYVNITPSFEFSIKEQATDGSGNYYATIGSLGEGNYVVSGGVTVSTIKVSSGVIQTVASFGDGEVIPGDGAYLVEGPVGTYNFQKSDDKTEYVFGQYGDNNWLRSTGEGNISAEEMAAPENDEASGYMYYKLSLRKGRIGFYWGVDGGAPFNYSTKHQAYLVVPLSETPSANANAIYFDGTTGIEAVKDAKTTTGTVHTLSGIRVDGKQLPKGIYIVDGKKIVVK